RRLVLELRGTLVALRSSLQGIFTAGKSTQLMGFGGRISRDPVVLERQALTALERLARPKSEWPETGVLGVSFDPEPWRASLLPRVEALNTRLLEIAHLEAAEAQVQGRQRRARKAFDSRFRPAARIVEDLCRLAGKPRLAARVRLDGSRPGRPKKPRKLRTAKSTAEAPGEGGTKTGGKGVPHEDGSA
ncbi:MAG: hypothetical protein KDD47_27155, partial [Acidobacteria bacterium]|nr:hypothetical protein [Acidobacteriota bacterium]